MITIMDIIDLVNHGAGGDTQGVIYAWDESSNEVDKVIDLDALTDETLQNVLDHPVHKIEIVKDPRDELAMMYHINMCEECPHPNETEPIPIMEYLSKLASNTNIIIEDFFNTDEFLVHFETGYAECRDGSQAPYLYLVTSHTSMRIYAPDEKGESFDD